MVDKKKKKKGFAQAGNMFSNYKLQDKGGYITHEFQDYGYNMAVKLNDLKHVSWYMRMSKTIDRSILERALAFVADAHTAKSKARLFMWKVKQLRLANEEKEKEKKKVKEVSSEPVQLGLLNE